MRKLGWGLIVAALLALPGAAAVPANGAPYNARFLDANFEKAPMVRVSLRLTDARGKLVSENFFYWRGREPAAYRALDALPKVRVVLAADAPVIDGQDYLVRVVLRNPSRTPALNVKLTLVNGSGARILPAYYSDNYVSLLPNETRMIEIRYPRTQSAPPFLTLGGWNAAPQQPVPAQ